MMAPAKKGSEKKGQPAINKVMTREYAISIHRASMKWVSRSLSLGHSKKHRNMPWRRWEPHMYASTPGSTKTSGSKIQGMSHTRSVCSCPENVIKMKANQTSSTCWLLTRLSPLSKIYRQLVWLRPNCWLSNKVIELPRKKSVLVWGTSLVVQRLRICLAMQGIWIQSLVSLCALEPVHHN